MSKTRKNTTHPRLINLVTTIAIVLGMLSTWNNPARAVLLDPKEFGVADGVTSSHPWMGGQSSGLGSLVETTASTVVVAVDISNNRVLGYYFLPAVLVTLTIDDPAIPGDENYKAEATSNASGYVYFLIGETFSLKTGMIVTLSDGTNTKDHVIRLLTIIDIDHVTDVITGTAALSSKVQVNGYVPDGLGGTIGSILDAISSQDGHWTADFKTADPPFDLVEGAYGTVTQYDDEWDYTIIFWALNIPANNLIDQPQLIEIIPFEHMVDSRDATHQPGEPTFAACGQEVGLATVWYLFEPTEDGEMALDTMGSNYDTMLGVWSGSPSALSLVGCNNDALGGVQSQLHFYYNAGTDYYIGVAQKGTVETGGEMKLHATTFADVPGNHTHWRNIEGLYAQGVTGGCSLSPLSYCPNNGVTRQQMAVFLLRSMFGSDYVPPEATGIFTDVPVTSFYAPWIEELYHQGITGGCSLSPLNYCPTNIVTRQQMAVFLLKAKEGSVYTPPPATGVFTDVLASSFFAPWIEELYERGITGGCSTDPLMYCPANPVTRGQMGTFIVRMFEFTPLP